MCHAVFSHGLPSIPALEVQPDDPHVLKRRADVRGKLGKRETAISDYRRAIDIQSKRKL